jgi:hypothetical protein
VLLSSRRGEPDVDLIHVSVASPAGAYTVGNAAFFRYIVRLAELGLALPNADQEALNVLAAIPHAFEGDEDGGPLSGSGWRLVPPRGQLDWATLEATPQRLRSAFERAHRILWANAARFSVSPREIASIEEELDAVYGVIFRAEAGGHAVNISYTA